MLRKKESPSPSAGVDSKAVVENPKRAWLTRRNFIKGTILGGIVVVIHHLLPPLPQTFSIFGPQTVLAQYCMPPCPPSGCNCYLPAWFVCCGDKCPEPPYGCYDYYTKHPWYYNLDPACCCDVWCGWLEITQVCDALPCRYGNCECTFIG